MSDKRGWGRRWRPRFGLKTLLIVMAVFATAFGYIGYLLRRVNHQRWVVAKVQEATGTVRYNWQIGMGPHLNWMTAAEVTSHELKDLPNGLHKIIRTSPSGTIVETEEYPGPSVLRMLLGNDAFAVVESVEFDYRSSDAGRFDPKLLLELPHLKMVTLIGSQVSDESLELVAQLPELRILNLAGDRGSTATKNGLANLESSKKLEALRLNGDWLTDDVLTGVRKLHQLRQLEVAFAPNLTGLALESVGELGELREFSAVRTTRIDDEGTEALSKLGNLRVLWMHETSVSDRMLANIAGLEQIEVLWLGKTNVGDRGVACLGKFSKLKMLDLSGTHVGDAGLETISVLPNVRLLRLGSTKVTDAGLPAIGKMSQLERLHLWPCDITDAGILHLQTLVNLKELGIGPDISKEATNELRKLLPKCKIRRTDSSGSSSFPDD